MKKWIAALGVFAVVIIFGLAGSADYEDQKAEAEYYCAMVFNGYWGAYNKSIDCEKLYE